MRRMRGVRCTLGVVAVLGLGACAGEPANSTAAPSGHVTFRFVGSVDPIQRTMTITRAEPGSSMASALGTIPVTAPDGDPTTVDDDTVQVYGSNVEYASAGTGYPPECSTSIPAIMQSDVEILSGYSQQLRNVFARMTAITPGFSFCSADSPGGFTEVLEPNQGLYNFEVIDPFATQNENLMPAVSKHWAIALPNNNGFGFVGEVQAEVIPADPINLSPVQSAVFHTGSSGITTMNVTFSWADDPLANGTDPEGYGIARPLGGASVAVYRCNTASTSNSFNPAACEASPRFSVERVTTGSQVWSLTAGYWWRWVITSAFVLPGDTAVTLAKTSQMNAFKVLRP